MYGYLVTIAKDMVSLTKELSVNTKPDTAEALEILTGLSERLAKGKYDIECKNQLTETRARIEDELSERKFNVSALRSQMRTQHAKWVALQDKFSALTRSKTGTESLLLEPTSYLDFKPVPKKIPPNKNYISFRHQVIFTNRHIISAEGMKRLPEPYKAVKLGSGYRFDNQLIVAINPSNSDEKNNANVRQIISRINTENNRKYISSFLDSSNGPMYFRVPSSSLIYVWMVPQNIARHIRLDLRSVILPDRDIDVQEKPKMANSDQLRLLRVKLENMIATDSQIKALRAEKTRLELLSRKTDVIESKIQERMKQLREDIKKEVA